jgi:hypothetical protein
MVFVTGVGWEMIEAKPGVRAAPVLAGKESHEHS